MGAKNSKANQEPQHEISAPVAVKVPVIHDAQPIKSIQPSPQQKESELQRANQPGNSVSSDASNNSRSRESVTPLHGPELIHSTQPGLPDSVETADGSAQDSLLHWDAKVASKGEGLTESIGGHKVINKELQKTMHHTMKITKNNSDLRELVKLPANADLHEWIALNTIHFYRSCALIAETYREICTPETCPLMSAGNVEYLWKDAHQYPKPSRIPACQYMELALREALICIEDERVFPVEASQMFPPNFMQKVREIFKRLFRQFAHLYYSHYDKIKAAGSNKHLNSSFKHFIYFVQEFQLVDQATLSPLQKFIDHIMSQNGK